MKPKIRLIRARYANASAGRRWRRWPVHAAWSLGLLMAGGQASQGQSAIPFQPGGSTAFDPVTSLTLDTDTAGGAYGGVIEAVGSNLISNSSGGQQPMEVMVYDFSSINIQPGVTVNLQGSLPAVFLSASTINISGLLNASGQTGGAGTTGLGSLQGGSGGGGGGGGGAVALFSAEGITIGSSGQILATGGAAGIGGSQASVSGNSLSSGAGGLGGMAGPGGSAGGDGGASGGGGNGGAGSGATGWAGGGGGGGGGALFVKAVAAGPGVPAVLAGGVGGGPGAASSSWFSDDGRVGGTVVRGSTTGASGGIGGNLTTGGLITGAFVGAGGNAGPAPAFGGDAAHPVPTGGIAGGAAVPGTFGTSGAGGGGGGGDFLVQPGNVVPPGSGGAPGANGGVGGAGGTPGAAPAPAKAPAPANPLGMGGNGGDGGGGVIVLGSSAGGQIINYGDINVTGPGSGEDGSVVTFGANALTGSGTLEGAYVQNAAGISDAGDFYLFGGTGGAGGGSAGGVVQLAPTPEPSSTALMVVGVAAVWFQLGRRSRTRVIPAGKPGRNGVH